MTELRWHPQAVREARAARRWYKLERDAPGAARGFQEALQRALEQIADAPVRWPTLVDDFRKRPLRRFPFRVVYQIRSDHVLIVAVMHERQHPEYWRIRTNSER
jgi:plasmid stabilization system protein ParE